VCVGVLPGSSLFLISFHALYMSDGRTLPVFPPRDSSSHTEACFLTLSILILPSYLTIRQLYFVYLGQITNRVLAFLTRALKRLYSVYFGDSCSSG